MPMRTLGLFFAFGALLSPTAVAQEVTFAELQGTVIETTVVLQQVVRREGKEFENRVQQDLKLIIGPGEWIESTWTPALFSSGGVLRKGQTQTGSFPLERPSEVKPLGGGRSMWVFSKGTLTNLRTLITGAYKGILFLLAAPQASRAL